MKKLLMTVMVAAALSTSVAMAYGGENGGHGGHGGMGMMGGHMTQLQSQLNLTTAQVEQIKLLQAEQKTQMDAARVAGQTRIAQLLTPEQATKFKDMTSKMEQRRAQHDANQGEGHKGRGEGRGHHGEGKDGGRGAGRGHMMGMGGMQHGAERLKADLNLTPEQVTQVDAIMQDQQAQMDQFHAATKNRMVQLLTADQATKFQSMQTERKQRMQEHLKQMQQRVERM